MLAYVIFFSYLCTQNRAKENMKRNTPFKLRFDRALASGIWKQLGILAAIIVVMLAVTYIFLAFTCDWTRFSAEHHVSKFALPWYLLIDQNLYNEIYLSQPGSSHVYGTALRLISGFTFLCGVVFFNGAIIAILSDLLKRRVENYKNGTTHYFKKNHYVIMGYDDIVPSMIAYILRENPNNKILLLTSAPAKMIMEKLRESVARESIDDNIVINFGHRVSSDYYKDIHLETARQIFIAGDRRKPQHDAVNVECIQSVCAYLSQQPSHTVERITCVFEDLDTYTSFKTTDIFTDITTQLNIEFVPYNHYVGWAHRVFNNRSGYPCLSKNGIGLKDDHYVHLVFVGTTNFAVTFANEAAHLFHFPNYKKAKTRITFIDRNADVEMDVFATRNHHFFEVQSCYYRDMTGTDPSVQQIDTRLKFSGKDSHFLDVDFEFIKGDIFKPEVQNLVYEWAKDEQQYLSIFLAMTNQRDNFAFAMNMPDAIYNNDIPVFIRQDSSDNFITLLRQADEKAPRKGDSEYRTFENGQLKIKPCHGRYSNIYPFGMNNTSFFGDEVSFRRAKLINFLYDQKRTLQELRSMSETAVWEKADALWDTLTVAEKWSNLYFAYSIPYKQQSMQVMEAEGVPEKQRIEAVSIAEHNRWNVEKLLMGYRKPKASEDLYQAPNETIAQQLANNRRLFIHAQIRPYEELTEAMKQLDRDFVTYIPWIIEMTVL